MEKLLKLPSSSRAVLALAAGAPLRVRPVVAAELVMAPLLVMVATVTALEFRKSAMSFEPLASILAPILPLLATMFMLAVWAEVGLF